MTAAHLPRLHLLEEVAKRYRLKLRPLRERARRKEFTHVQIGRERYLTDEQIKALLAKFTVTSQSSDSKREQDLAAVRERIERQQQRGARRRPAA